MKKRSSRSKASGKKQQTPVPRAGHIMERLEDGSGMIVLGGYSDRGPLQDMWKYTFEGGWKMLSTGKSESPLPRMMSAGCMLDGLYIFGGIQQRCDEVLILNDIWKFDIERLAWQRLWEECPISERYNHVAVSIPGNRMIVHGGECMNLLGDCWLYDAVHNSFEQISTPPDASPCPRSSHSAIYCAPFVVVFGGVTRSNDEDASPAYLNDLWLLNTSGSSDADRHWQMVSYESIAPSPRDLPGMVDVSGLVGVEGDVLILGGYGLLEEEDSDDSQDDRKEVNEEELVEGGNLTSSCATPLNMEDVNVALVEAESSIHSDEPTQLPAKSIAATVEPTPCSEEQMHTETMESDDEDLLGVSEGYLGDAWVVNIHSAKATEVEVHDSAVENHSPMAFRGRTVNVLNHNGASRLVTFGGFNGSTYAGLGTNASVQSLG